MDGTVGMTGGRGGMDGTVGMEGMVGGRAVMGGYRVMAPSPPRPRGPLSEAVVGALRHGLLVPLGDARTADPYGEDLQLALYTCYELHYQGFAEVDPAWEWEPELLRLRGALERRFLTALRADLPGGDDVASALDRLLVEPPDPGHARGRARREAGKAAVSAREVGETAVSAREAAASAREVREAAASAGEAGEAAVSAREAGETAVSAREAGAAAMTAREAGGGGAEPPGARGSAPLGVSGYLRDDGEPWQVREFLAHRSIYHLKEADPHAWVIPRLSGQAKAALVAVEFDEFGGGNGTRMHSRLFAGLLADAGLDPAYGYYLDAVPAVTLATVNMMSLFGLHRSLRGALVGHFAAAEISTPPSARRMAEALGRFGLDPHFYTEHIEADAVHEQVLRHEVIGDLLTHEPYLAADVVLGIQATEELEARLGAHLLGRWRTGRSSLRYALSPS